MGTVLLRDPPRHNSRTRQIARKHWVMHMPGPPFSSSPVAPSQPPSLSGCQSLQSGCPRECRPFSSSVNAWGEKAVNSTWFCSCIMRQPAEKNCKGTRGGEASRFCSTAGSILLARVPLSTKKGQCGVSPRQIHAGAHPSSSTESRNMAQPTHTASFTSTTMRIYLPRIISPHLPPQTLSQPKSHL